MTEVWDEARGVERLATGARWLEGPAWTERGVLVSDIPNNRILNWTPEGWTTAVQPSEFSNGRIVDAAGRVFQCSHGRRAIEELHPDGTVTTVVDRFEGRRLNSPNDIAVAPDGALWFTDPPYGLTQPDEGYPGEQEYGACFVFRYDVATGELTAAITDMEEPNGVAFSPDGRTVYVSDTSAARSEDGLQHLRAYAVDGAATESKGVLFTGTRGLIDGFAVDAAGRVWASHGSSVTVVDDQGTVVADIAIGERVANLCFGGPDFTDVYVAASTSLYRLGSLIPGVRVTGRVA